MPLARRLLSSPPLPVGALLLLAVPGSSVLARTLLVVVLSGSEMQSMILTATRPPCHMPR